MAAKKWPFKFMKKYFLLIIAVIIIVVAKLVFSLHLREEVDYKRCSDFGTQENAQRAFDSNEKKYAWADRDGDKKACETLSTNREK